MKTLFFGTSAFAVPSLHVLMERTDVFGVVTQPDRPAGRGHRIVPSPVKAAALERGLTVLQPTHLRDLARDLAGEGIDLFALSSYGRILPQVLLDVPPLGALNVHPSLLPSYRGATPIQTALRNGAHQTGVSIMLMDDGMDTGEIALQEPVPIGPDETYGDLHDRLARIGARLLGEAIELLSSRTLTHHPQIGEPTVTSPLHKNDLQIDWAWNAQRIVNTVRAFAPQPAARAQLFGVPVKLLRAHVATKADAGALVVPCGDGAVVVDEVIAPNHGCEPGVVFRMRHRDRTVTE
ncbi:MAG: methionyl-tRNA formyltransferase [Vulcanimicrobiaceae bacterium]